MKTIKKTILPLLLTGTCLSANAAVISGVNAVASSDWASPGTVEAAQLVNDSGLSAPGSLAATHSEDGSAIGQWHSNSAVTGVTVTFDLGGTFDLNSAHIWQANQPGNFGRGVNQFDILISTDGLNYSEVVTDTTLAISGGGEINAQVKGLVQSGVTHVQFHIDTSHGDANFVGLSEVKFDGVASVPEPSSAALLGLGGLALILRRRM